MLSDNDVSENVRGAVSEDQPKEATNDVSEQLLTVIKAKEGGVTNADLTKELPDIPPAAQVQSINKLLQDGKIEVFQKGKKLVYCSKDAKKSLPKGSDSEEKVVYGIIEGGGNKGIWIRDIRMQSNLNMTQLNKILKNLETKKLIKAVKSVSASKKKVYMLYNLEADRSITGGAWYQDQDFEGEFVDILNQQSLRFLQIKRSLAETQEKGPLETKRLSYCSVAEVHKFISDLGISKVKLDEDDLETILKTVVYDGKAEQSVIDDEGRYVYYAVKSPLPPVGLTQMPCGICPIIKHCSMLGDVTPAKCSYFTDWLL